MNAVFHQRGSALALLIFMMLHVHGVSGGPIRILLLVSAMWHAVASVHIVLGDYPIPRIVRQGVSGTIALGALGLCLLSGQAIHQVYQPDEAPPSTQPQASWAQAEPLIARCMKCHAATARDMKAWAETTPVREKVASGHKLTPDESAVLLGWIDAGMPGETATQ